MAFGSAEYIPPCRRDREPALEDLLRDPTIQAVMASDRVSHEDLTSLLGRMRAGLLTRRMEARN